MGDKAEKFVPQDSGGDHHIVGARAEAYNTGDAGVVKTSYDSGTSLQSTAAGYQQTINNQAYVENIAMTLKTASPDSEAWRTAALEAQRIIDANNITAQGVHKTIATAQNGIVAINDPANQYMNNNFRLTGDTTTT